MITLKNNNTIPKIGFGTYKITDPVQMEKIIPEVLKIGYRFIDTASFYKNEDLIGNVLKNTGMRREDYQLATKIWPSSFGYDKAMESIESSLDKLGTDYIDLMYLHWPGKDMEGAYKAMEKMYDQKVIKNLGLSNFHQSHYEQVTARANVEPVVAQIEINPYFLNREVVDFYNSLDVQVVAWSPIGRLKDDALEDKVILDIAREKSATAAQVVLAFHISEGILPIPKTVRPELAKENYESINITLSQEEVNAIKSIDKNQRTGANPDDKDWIASLKDM